MSEPNPHWDSKMGRPIAIFTRTEWDEAEAQGWLTAQHVFGRIFNIAVHELGNQTHAGFDSDGFYVSLVADGVKLENGISLHVYGNDHPPPHVHVRVKARPEWKKRFRLDDGQLMDEPPRGLPGKKLAAMQRAIEDHRELLAGHHGGPLVY